MSEFVLAKETDAPTIARLRQEIWASTYRGIYPDDMIDQFDHAWHTARDLSRIQNEAYLVFLIKDEAASVGYLTLKKGEPLLLLSLYVLKDYQHRGIGRAAFALICRYCAQSGLTNFTCQCQPQNASAVDFYRAMGGVITARDEGNDETWQDSVKFTFSVEENCDEAYAQI